MSRFVLTTEGDRVNLDLLVRIRFESYGARALILGSTRTFTHDEEVVLVDGLDLEVGRLWQTWDEHAVAGADLTTALEKENGR